MYFKTKMSPKCLFPNKSDTKLNIHYRYTCVQAPPEASLSRPPDLPDTPPDPPPDPSRSLYKKKTSKFKLN